MPEKSPILTLSARVNILAGDSNFFLSRNLDYPYFFLEFHGFFDAAACVAELLRQLTKEIEENFENFLIEMAKKPLNCQKSPKTSYFRSFFGLGRAYFFLDF